MRYRICFTTKMYLNTKWNAKQQQILINHIVIRVYTYSICILNKVKRDNRNKYWDNIQIYNKIFKNSMVFDVHVYYISHFINYIARKTIQAFYY